MIYHGDCFEIMPQIPEKSVDLILCDPPYSCGKTAHKQDKEIDLTELWKEYDRLLKSDGIVCLFGNEPFTSKLILSNIDMFRYKMIWEKESPTCFLNANYKPLSKFEDIIIFSRATVGSLSKQPIRYYPQGLIPKEQVKLLGVEVRKNPFERVAKGDSYYSVTEYGNIDDHTECGDYADKCLYDSINYFNDDSVAQQVTLHQLLYRKLLKFAYDNECEDNQTWNNVNCHYYIRYNINEDRFYTDATVAFKHNDVWFCSRDSATRAIEEIIKPFMKEHPEFVW